MSVVIAGCFKELCCWSEAPTLFPPGECCCVNSRDSREASAASRPLIVHGSSQSILMQFAVYYWSILHRLDIWQPVFMFWQQL